MPKKKHASPECLGYKVTCNFVKLYCDIVWQGQFTTVTGKFTTKKGLQCRLQLSSDWLIFVSYPQISRLPSQLFLPENRLIKLFTFNNNY